MSKHSVKFRWLRLSRRILRGSFLDPAGQPRGRTRAGYCRTRTYDHFYSVTAWNVLLVVLPADTAHGKLKLWHGIHVKLLRSQRSGTHPFHHVCDLYMAPCLRSSDLHLQVSLLFVTSHERFWIKPILLGSVNIDIKSLTVFWHFDLESMNLSKGWVVLIEEVSSPSPIDNKRQVFQGKNTFSNYEPTRGWHGVVCNVNPHFQNDIQYYSQIKLTF